MTSRRRTIRTPRRDRAHRDRLHRDRLRRGLLAALVAASVALPVSGAAGATEIPAPAPARLGPLSAATSADLAQRYAARRDGIRAAADAAEAHGSLKRAAALRQLADPARQFYSFDGRDGGRSVEVFGDLARADRIAVLVPGADTSVDHYDRLRNSAEALLREAGPRTAVVAWVGYRTPATVSTDALTAGLAHGAARELAAFSAELTALRPGVPASYLCHSYGAVVCTWAAPDLGATNLVLFGSPGVGTGAERASDLGGRATVWAGRGSADWIGGVPHVSLDLGVATVGFGADPAAPEFGAHPFDAGDSDHSGYLSPGSASLAHLADIVTGAVVPGGAVTGRA
ncbi:alpha/beta hydrolase family protein [Streptomyces sp. NBC_00237]|uniref:alpha/beta hydrolase n=1 Tax=Streptomyces sp. NBC_00237 TaxID=2975687 RepID=UPI00225A7EC4|nr:alpha/beta hydrolase [Streptomyces sp. NBC_00237]MCX5203324.1 alpha/beta hydrolase family protein [Streptomyces sp. NBC_00237]